MCITKTYVLCISYFSLVVSLDRKTIMVTGFEDSVAKYFLKSLSHAIETFGHPVDLGFLSSSGYREMLSSPTEQYKHMMKDLIFRNVDGIIYVVPSTDIEKAVQVKLKVKDFVNSIGKDIPIAIVVEHRKVKIDPNNLMSSINSARSVSFVNTESQPVMQEIMEKIIVSI